MSESLVEFLLARIAEDEATYRAEAAGIEWLTTNGGRNLWDHLLAECEAKRRIVEHCDFDQIALSPGDPYVLQLLALPYVDHSDYREEWKP